MTEKEKITMTISDAAAGLLDQLTPHLPKSKGEQLLAAFALAQHIVALEDSKDPLILVLGNIEITNQPFRHERDIKFREAIAKLSSNDKSILEEIYESAQLKPSLFGVGIDLKPLIKLAKKFFSGSPSS